MHAIAFTLAGRPIYWYGILMALAFLGGIGTWTLLGRREGRPAADCADLGFWVMLSGIAGARIAYVAANWSEYAGRPLSILRVDQGGLVFYGGLLGAGAALVALARLRREPLLHLLDFVITAIPLGHVLGRLGCFLNGCCYGAPHAGFPGVSYPVKSPPWWDQLEGGLISPAAPRSVPVHPVQLYEALANLALYAILVAAYPRRRADGRVIGLYLLLYPPVRFGLEFLRGDPRLTRLGLSLAQWASLAIFALGVGIWLHSRRAARARADRPA